MPDALTTITHLINSPPGQLAAGGVLAGIVWKFFERVENVLTNDTKLEVAQWLQGVKMERWPQKLASGFEQVFGHKHWSWKCISRSCQISLCVFVVVTW